MNKKIRLLYRSLIVIAFLTISGSCATIIYGTKELISVNSEPNGAEVYINGKYFGVTPGSYNIKRRQKKSEFNRKNELNYVIKKEGYEDGQVKSFGKVSWAAYIDMFLNVPAGALLIGVNLSDPETRTGGLILGIPLIISFPLDLITGSVLAYDKNVYAKLRPGASLKNKEKAATGASQNKYMFRRSSDVDVNIPKGPLSNPLRFALIIGNEDYSSFQPDLNSEVNVTYARNDASAFRDYVTNLLGVPEQNIVFLLDATTGQMKQALSKANLIIKNSNGEAEFIVYYAGHGLSDEINKEPYLIPVDISGKNVTEGIMLADMYSRLTQYGSKRVTVFIDACFSGGARNQELVGVRGVRIVPKENEIGGRLVAFCSSSGLQTSLPYIKQQHGLFTYFLLLKLQEKKENLTYGELSDYLLNTVPVKSVLINNKEQTPFTKVSRDILNEWSSWKFR
jgi:hypothetical protein